MSIKEIISKYYYDFLEHCKSNKVISQGRTEEDILQDVCITALNKYKHSEVSEDEGYQYIKKTLLMEKHFQFARKKNEMLIFTDDLTRF